MIILRKWKCKWTKFKKNVDISPCNAWHREIEKHSRAKNSSQSMGPHKSLKKKRLLQSLAVLKMSRNCYNDINCCNNIYKPELLTVYDVSNSVCFIHFFPSYLTLPQKGYYVILQMLRLREIRSVVQSHMVCKWQNWNCNQETYSTKCPLYPSLGCVYCVCICFKIDISMS